MTHDWDDKTGICIRCGVTTTEYMNESEWGMLFCSGQLSLPIQKTQCCNFPAIVCLGEKWVCESCGGPDITRNTNKMQNYTVTKCTCGALKVHGENTPGHYNDCDLRKRK